MLRFMADEYDDTCSTVFPLLQTLLSSVSDGTQCLEDLTPHLSRIVQTDSESLRWPPRPRETLFPRISSASHPRKDEMGRKCRS